MRIFGPYTLRKLLLLSCVTFSTQTFSENTSNENLSNNSHGKQGASQKKSDTPSAPRILGQVPDFSLIDQNGEAFTLSDLSGHVWVVNFIFTECHGICPVQTQRMNALNKSLYQLKNPKGVHLVSISVDPETDTPEVLSEYIAERKINTSQWSFLTGTRDEIWKLSKQGFKLPVAENAMDTDMPILHSGHFVLVDSQGKIRGYYNSLKPSELDKMTQDLVTITKQIHPVPADVMSPAWVKPRMERQLASKDNIEVFNDFKFHDESKKSGITFRHKIVDDVGSVWKATHYDHGNGLAVADVDSDGLYDIYFTTLSGSNELWRNLGDGKFENITDSSGLYLDDRIGMSASFADIDNDGDQDLYITNIREGNILYENDGKGRFKNITDSSGTGVKAHSCGAIFFDYDRDGLLDLFVTNVGEYTSEQQSNATLYTEQGQIISEYKFYNGHKDAFAGHLKKERSEASVLFRNLGNNKFEDVSKKVNLVELGWNGDATIIDGNNDGWPDLYLTNMQGNDEYFENQNGNQFVRKSREVFTKTPWGAMGVKSLDYNNDGHMDLYISDMHSDMREDPLGKGEKYKAPQPYPTEFLRSGGNSLFGNAFYRNEGNGEFTEISDAIGAETFWPWGISSGDFNADGYEDVFLPSSMNFPFRYAPNALLLNNNGKGFVNSEYILGVEPRKNNQTALPWFELYCSGRDAENPLCKSAEGPRVVWGALGSRSSAIFDLDMDGDQDIVTLEFNQPPMVLLSELSEKKKINYLKIKLNGKRSNKSGIGAQVKVYSGKNIYTKVQDGKSGYLSQSLLPLYFGLADNKRIDKIEITWPSGKQQTISKNIKINQLLEIKES